MAGHGIAAAATHGAYVTPAQTGKQASGILTCSAHLLGEQRNSKQSDEAQRDEYNNPATSHYHIRFSWLSVYFTIGGGPLCGFAASCQL
jgi:hypothetical protein